MKIHEYITNIKSKINRLQNEIEICEEDSIYAKHLDYINKIEILERRIRNISDTPYNKMSKELKEGLKEYTEERQKLLVQYDLWQHNEV